jgi:hypothetical protein
MLQSPPLEIHFSKGNPGGYAGFIRLLAGLLKDDDVALVKAPENSLSTIL